MDYLAIVTAVVYPESSEWFTEDQTFSLKYDLAPPPPPPLTPLPYVSLTDDTPDD